MIYLDYSATTPVNPEVLDAFHKFNLEHYGNPNSSHELGVFAKSKVEETSLKIKNILHVQNYEVIYTSGATEANNLAIKGFAFSNQYRGKHIISCPYEHSSVTSCLNYLAKLDYDIDILSLDETGKVNLDELEELIRDDTILVSISLVNSELGIIQDIERIKAILKKHPQVKFHSDLTQAIGKVPVDLAGIDLISFTAHKIYGIKGIGALLRKSDINLTPVIHGGKSISIFRGGTPSTPLIHSLGVALESAYKEFDNKRSHIKKLHEYLITNLETIPIVHLNYKDGIDQIINVSFKGIPAINLQKALSQRGIYISTQTACNSEASYSKTVSQITGSEEFAETSVRISLSHLTTQEDLTEFLHAVKDIIHENH